MKLAKRTETEVRDSLHDAIDRMSIMEIVVLIFLVQMIRTREFVSHILPAPRKALPAPVEETLFPGLDAQIATGCTDPEPERDLESDLSSAIDEIARILREANHPVLQEPTEKEWNRMYAEAPPYFSAPIPMPSPMYTRDFYGRPRVGSIQSVEPRRMSLGPPPEIKGEWVDGGVAPFENARIHYDAALALCTPSRNPFTSSGELLWNEGTGRWE